MTELIALYHYFQGKASLPYPEGPLSDSVRPAAIRDVNDPLQSKSRSGSREMGVVFIWYSTAFNAPNVSLLKQNFVTTSISRLWYSKNMFFIEDQLFLGHGDGRVVKQL